MARSLTIVVLCLCLTVAFAADLRRLIAERAAGVPQTPRAGADGKASTGDLDTANSFGYGWGGFGGPWGGFGGYGPGWGWGGFGGPWSYGYGFPYGGYW